jgi:hypothetical protein
MNAYPGAPAPGLLQERRERDGGDVPAAAATAVPAPGAIAFLLLTDMQCPISAHRTDLPPQEVDQPEKITRRRRGLSSRRRVIRVLRRFQRRGRGERPANHRLCEFP